MAHIQYVTAENRQQKRRKK